MRRKAWKTFLDQYTVALEQWEWELLPSQGQLRRVREDQSSGNEFEAKDDFHGPRIHIYVRTSLVATERDGSSKRSPLASFEAEVLDISDEEVLTFYWRHRERHGWDTERQQSTREYRFEHAASLPWEEILLMEYVGLAGKRDL